MKMESKAFMNALSGEEGQVWTYILKIFLAALVVGLVISQCGPIILNQITTRTTAKDAAELAADTYMDSKGDMAKVKAEVKNLLDERGARLDGEITVVYDESGQARKISVPVRKITNTFLFERVSYLSPYTEAHSRAETDLY